MSLQQLKEEASSLTDSERRELVAYLLGLGRQRSPEYWNRIAEKIDDNDPAHWVNEESLDSALGLNQPGK